MRYLHTMLRVTDLDRSVRFYREGLGFELVSRRDYPDGRFTLAFLQSADDSGTPGMAGKPPMLELTHNWDGEDYGEARHFGHLAYEVDDIYATCESLMKAGVTINRPPRDGQMAFIRSPDLHSIELLQKGDALPPAEPWKSMGNTGHW